jgi:hypothetical protein
MVDPLGITASVAQLLQMGAAGVAWLRREMPEYGRFWDKFEKQLKNEPEVPGDELRAKSYLQPDFVGWALLYIAGDSEGRDGMEAHFASIVPLEVLAQVKDAARVAASSSSGRPRIVIARALRCRWTTGPRRHGRRRS